MNIPWKNAITILSLILLGVVYFFVVQFLNLAEIKQQLETDRSEINHIRYGLLNVDEWSDKVEVILDKKIREFEIKPENE